MVKNIKFRIYPTKSQATKLDFTLEECRWLWNLLLGQRKTAWETDKQSILCFAQQARLPKLKSERETLKLVHSQVLQNVAERLDLAFKTFFRRLRRHETPGYPRFRGKGRYNSFCYPQCGFKLSNDRLFLSKIGHVKAVIHHPIEGKIKRCTVKCTPTGKWFAAFSVEVKHKADPVEPKTMLGLDVGINSFLATSDGDKVTNPRFFKQDSKALTKAQRKHSKTKSKQTRKVVARIHERISNRRDNFAHQLSRQFVNANDLLVVEDLNINRLKEDSYRVLNREISDVAWRSFTDKLVYKAEWAGKQVVKVNPAYTSQDCSSCGYRVEKKLSDRVHVCPACSLELDRDINAAKNILALGLQCLAQQPRSLDL